MGENTAVEVGRLYPPLKAIADVLTASQKDVFVRLPGLLGYWPMGIREAPAGKVMEHSYGGLPLTQVGVVPTGYDGNSFVHLGDGINYLFSTSGTVTGTETFIDTNINGLTFGCWLSIDGYGGSNSGVISKDGAATNRGYSMFFTSAGAMGVAISGNGASTFSAAGAVVPLSSWAFVCGRFIPSTEIAVFVNSIKSVTAVAIPAAIYLTTQQFEIGRFFNADSTVAHARVRDAFLCAAALTDEQVSEIRLSSAP